VARIGDVATDRIGAWDRDGTVENRLLRGREGSSVRVELLREGGAGEEGEHRVPVLLRRRSFAARHYPALAVRTLLDGEGRRVAYIRLRRFDAQATAQLRSVLYAEERVGASAYVVDLRNNMGGIFQEALKVAALFLPDPNVS
jgi:carboxyl-terminal processing protease